MSVRDRRVGEILKTDAFDAVAQLNTNTVDSVVTSPPYWGLRDYGVDGQFGVEEKAADYIGKLSGLASDLSDAVTEQGSIWINVGDTYNGSSIIRKCGSNNPDKGDKGYSDQLAENREQSGVMRRSSEQFGLSRQNRLLIPERLAMSIQNEGWTLRDRVIWHKPNPKPEGRVQSRLKQSHETLLRFVQSESAKFYRDRLPSATDVWTVETADSDHPAPMPADIARRSIRATTDKGDTVLDPFCGSGTVCDVAHSLDREYIGMELNPEFAEMAREQIGETPAHGLSRWAATAGKGDQ